MELSFVSSGAFQPVAHRQDVRNKIEYNIVAIVHFGCNVRIYLSRVETDWLYLFVETQVETNKYSQSVET